VAPARRLGPAKREKGDPRWIEYVVLRVRDDYLPGVVSGEASARSFSSQLQSVVLGEGLVLGPEWAQGHRIAGHFRSLSHGLNCE